jgi:hypothetical protein
MGYSGDMGQFQDFVEQDPARQARMDQFKNAAVQMARGGAVQRANVVRMQEGGDPPSLEDQLASAQEAFNNTRYARIGRDTIDLSRAYVYERYTTPSDNEVVRVKDGDRTYSFRGDSYNDFNSQLGKFIRAQRVYNNAQENLQDIQNQIAQRAAQEAEAEAERQRKAEEEAKRKAEEAAIQERVDAAVRAEREKLEREAAERRAKREKETLAQRKAREEEEKRRAEEEKRRAEEEQKRRTEEETRAKERAKTEAERRRRLKEIEDALNAAKERERARDERERARAEAEAERRQKAEEEKERRRIQKEEEAARQEEERRRQEEEAQKQKGIDTAMSTFPSLGNTKRPQINVGDIARPPTAADYGITPQQQVYVAPNLVPSPITYAQPGQAYATPPVVQPGQIYNPTTGTISTGGGLQASNINYTLAQPTISGQTGSISTQPIMAVDSYYKGGVVKMNTGGNVQTIEDMTVSRFLDPKIPKGAEIKAAQTFYDPAQYISPTTGQVGGFQGVGTETAATETAQLPDAIGAAQFDATTVATDVDKAIQATQAAMVTPDDPRAKVTAAQQTKSSVGDLSAAQGNAILIDNPVQRELQEGELISGAAADASKAAKFTEQVQAATATPSQKATVQGQLAGLMQQFEGGATPSWAAGAMRAATSAMAARGLGASSIAGQAIVQAAMESALPIAQADASTVAQFEAQNLSNRQQRAMLAAQQRAEFLGQEFNQEFQARVQNASRVADIANMNFTAEQQVQLENSRIANSMNLANLNNNQAMVMAEAAALANMDTANLNNRQQAAVQNAQAFMQRDLANLSNQQQMQIFKAQQRTQALFTDQAAVNAAQQFNATSQNQTNQFFANLQTQARQFNATQANAQNQFNAGQRNAMEKFNMEVANQRDQFNAQNQLVIAQSNAQWRRQIATADTAAANRANELNAQNVLNISNTAYNNLWQYYGDTMEFAWRAAESELDRMNRLAVTQMSADAQVKAAELARSSQAGQAVGSLLGTVLTGGMKFGFGNLFGG